MTKCVAGNIWSSVNINFKGKQTTKFLRCGCCWVVNDKREKLEKIRLKEQLNGQ